MEQYVSVDAFVVQKRYKMDECAGWQHSGVHIIRDMRRVFGAGSEKSVVEEREGVERR